jgi:uncharacterized FlaG/YvyC family protein
MSHDIDPIAVSNMPVNGVSWATDHPSSGIRSESQKSSPTKPELPSAPELAEAANTLQEIVNSVSDTSLSFSVEQELSRMVVAVRAVGSDEIIRQFPPEEFITVAKFIAAQNPDHVSDDFLKGILFDEHS